MHLIYKLGTGKPRSIDDVIGRSIEVVAGSSHADMLRRCRTAYPDLTWSENADVEVARLLAKVAAADVEFTIADSTEFNIQRHFYPDLRVALDLEIDDPLAWAFPKEGGDTLLSRADDFLIEFDRAASSHRSRIAITDIPTSSTMSARGISFAITKAACHVTAPCLNRPLLNGVSTGACWQQSVTRNRTGARSAVSPTGVRGIMMLTEATADYLGIEDRVDPRNSIFGGAQYFRTTNRTRCRYGR